MRFTQHAGSETDPIDTRRQIAVQTDIWLTVAVARRAHDAHHSFERRLTGAGIDHIDANVELPPPFHGDIHAAKFRSWLNIDGDRLFDLTDARVVGLRILGPDFVTSTADRLIVLLDPRRGVDVRPLASPNVVRPRGYPIEPVLAAIAGSCLGDSVKASTSF